MTKIIDFLKNKFELSKQQQIRNSSKQIEDVNIWYKQKNRYNIRYKQKNRYNIADRNFGSLAAAAKGPSVMPIW